MSKTLRTGILVLLISLLLTSFSAATAGPMDSLKVTVDEVMQVLKASELDQDLKREKLSTTIRGAFDFASMAQRILARNWKKASPQERQQFTALLSALMEKSYIGNIEAYTDEKVAFVKERIKKNNAAIDTLILTDSKEIPVSYRMLLRDGDWKVYDVIVESVSFVNSYRSSYGEIIKKNGMTGLLAKMEEKLTQLQEQ